MTDQSTEGQPPQRVRRRASRPAGPASAEATEIAEVTTVVAEAVTETDKAADKSKRPKPAKAKKQPAKSATSLRPVKPPPRRRARTALVGWIALAAGLLAIGALTAGVTALFFQHRDAAAKQALDQRFVDTATQTVVNMYSYKQDNIEESVKRFVDGTSGPLRGMLESNNNVENIKAIYRQTNATSEAVVNGAALEAVDPVTDNASVLVSVRVTLADVDGVNKPSKPYRLRVIVHEDEAGKMTGFDLKWPNGGD